MRAKVSTVRQSVGALALAALALLFCYSPWGKAWDYFCYDMFFNLRGATAPPEEIVLVSIDEPSFGALQIQWPWPRGLHAKLIDQLFDAGAKAVALDILFAEPSRESEDQALAAAIARHPGVVLAADFEAIVEHRFDSAISVEPLPELLAAGAGIGVVRYPLDADGFLRRARPQISNRSSFAYSAALAFLGVSDSGLNPPAEFGINYAGPPRTITTVSYHQALEPDLHLRKNFFKDKLVFVGLDSKSEVGASEGRDRYPYPFTRAGVGTISGVEVHANAASNIIQRSGVTISSPKLTIILGLLLGTSFAVLFYRIKPLSAGLIGFPLILLFILLEFLHFKYSREFISPIVTIFPMFVAYLSSPFVHYVSTWREKVYIRKTFSTYLAPSLVNKLLESPQGLELGGEAAEVTVLFADIAGFTSLSEKIEPKRLVEILNRCLGELGDAVIRNNGMIDKYVGDCIMAVWGVPIADALQAKNACQAICEMIVALERLSDLSLFPDGARLRVRIGASTGEAIAGNVGGGQHRNYTVIGNTVNLAARLEHVNEIYGTKAIISESTAKLVSTEFELRELDLIAVKGQGQSLRIFELQGKKGELPDAKRELNTYFAEGLAYYKKREWQSACKAFERALAVAPKDLPSQLLKERCKSFSLLPPSNEWDGVFRIETK